ncbi:MAG: hypothetical protein IKZ07_03810 [Akkermansia sp.]|nr:hypothetical protein [Akkermansia sp.]
MANVVTVRIKTEPAAKAIKAYATSAAVVLTGTGGDRWATGGSGGATVERGFTVTVEFSGGES